MEAALALVVKYAQYIPLAIDAGSSVVDAISRMLRLAQGAEGGTITDEEVDLHRKALDKLIEDFNTPIPD